jgi:hypothetical protein
MSVIRTLGCAAAAAVLALSAAPALAADPPPSARQVELATKVFAAMHMDRTMEGMARSMAPTMAKQFDTVAPQMTPAQRQAVQAAIADAVKDLSTKLLAEMVPVYAQTFSEKELSDLLVFYESPTGKAMIDKQPLVMARLQPAMAQIMPEMMAKMQTRLCAELGCSAPVR